MQVRLYPNKIIIVLLFILSSFLITALAYAQNENIAFPGAEGGGMYSQGGRGGKVIFVDNLEDNNKPGTFRYAVNQKGARIIVFKLSGTIFLKAPLRITNDSLTIAGQSAPGDGITIAHYPVTVAANEVIIRYLRFRMGYLDNTLSGGDDAFSGRNTNNVIIDHCSISWSTDECSSFYDNENFTMQWCIISESLRLSGHSKGAHGYGAIWGGVNASYHHNLLAHHDSRTPRFGPGMQFAGQDKTDARNNVFYNWNGNGCYGGEAMDINIVNNYFKPGPATSSRIASRIMAINAKSPTDRFVKIRGIWGKYYINGNYFPNNSQVSNNNWEGVKIEDNTKENIIVNTPVTTTKVTTFTAQKAYKQVLAYAGSSKVRDQVDLRIIDETTNGTANYIGLSAYNGEGKSVGYPRKGIIDNQQDLKPKNAPANWSPWPELKSTPALLDSDNDGMPDEWEKNNGLNPYQANANGKNLSTIYDNIEVYLNDLVKHITNNQYL